MKERKRDMAYGRKMGNSQVMHVLLRPAEDFLFLFEQKIR